MVAREPPAASITPSPHCTGGPALKCGEIQGDLQTGLGEQWAQCREQNTHGWAHCGSALHPGPVRTRAGREAGRDAAMHGGPGGRGEEALAP